MGGPPASLPNPFLGSMTAFISSISHCVMSEIDYMTIAGLVTHEDGGILIGKVYGHSSNEHARCRQAGRPVLPAANTPVIEA